MKCKTHTGAMAISDNTIYQNDAVAELVDRESAVEKTVICGLYSAL